MTRDPNIAHPDFEDKHEMFKLLNLHLNTNPDGTYTYDSDWSDRRVAEETDIDFKAHHAASIRRAKFGNLTHQPPPEPIPATPSRLDIIEQRLNRIIDHLAGNSPRTAQYRRYLLDGHTTTAHLDDI